MVLLHGSSDPPEEFPLSAFADVLQRSSTCSSWDGRTWSGCRSVEGWRSSFPGGIRGSRRASCSREERLQQALRLADLPPDQLVNEPMPTMFSDSAPAELVEEFSASMREFHPAGVRANSRAFAEADLRDVLPRVDVPTLLLYGDGDVRAPAGVAHDIHAGIPGSRLVFIPGAGHVCNIDAPRRFNRELRAFLRSVAPG